MLWVARLLVLPLALCLNGVPLFAADNKSSHAELQRKQDELARRQHELEMVKQREIRQKQDELARVQKEFERTREREARDRAAAERRGRDEREQQARERDRVARDRADAQQKASDEKDRQAQSDQRKKQDQLARDEREAARARQDAEAREVEKDRRNAESKKATEKRDNIYTTNQAQTGKGGIATQSSTNTSSYSREAELRQKQDELARRKKELEGVREKEARDRAAAERRGRDEREQQARERDKTIRDRAVVEQRENDAKERKARAALQEKQRELAEAERKLAEVKRREAEAKVTKSAAETRANEEKARRARAELQQKQQQLAEAERKLLEVKQQEVGAAEARKARDAKEQQTLADQRNQRSNTGSVPITNQSRVPQPLFSPQLDRYAGKQSSVDVLTSSQDKAWTANLTRPQRRVLAGFPGEQIEEIKKSGRLEAFKNQIETGNAPSVSSTSLADSTTLGKASISFGTAPSSQTANSTPSTEVPGSGIPALATKRNLDGVQIALGAVGLTPVGAGPDVANSIVSLARGDMKGAALDLAAAVPVTGVPVGAARIVQRVDRAAERSHLHHPWPKYLGGDPTQILEGLPQSLHIKYHSGLDKVLPRQRGGDYYNNLPSSDKASVKKDFEAYTKAFDAQHSTSLWSAALKNGFLDN